MNTPVNYELEKLLSEKGYDKLIALGDEATISDVIMWLYEKHNVWLWVNRWYQQDENVNYWSYYIDGEETVCYCESPTEAYEKAIEYVLKKFTLK